MLGLFSFHWCRDRVSEKLSDLDKSTKQDVEELGSEHSRMANEHYVL